MQGNGRTVNQGDISSGSSLLKKEKKHTEIIRIGKESLDTLVKGTFRERVAEFMIDAAEKLNDRDHLLLGKRERFLSISSDQNLLDLVAEAAVQNRRNDELAEILRFFETGGAADKKGILHTKALLMGREIGRSCFRSKE